MAITSPKKNEELAKQFKINPEVNAKLEAFMRSEPGLVDFVKQIPREQLERKFLLRKMQDQQQKEGYTAKVKTWLEKPEQAEVLKAIRTMISPVMKPERQEQLIVNQAKNFIKNTGVKLS
jgi:ribonuclease D